jgi:hypothetical protein
MFFFHLYSFFVSRSDYWDHFEALVLENCRAEMHHELLASCPKLQLPPRGTKALPVSGSRTCSSHVYRSIVGRTPLLHHSTKVKDHGFFEMIFQYAGDDDQNVNPHSRKRNKATFAADEFYLLGPSRHSSASQQCISSDSLSNLDPGHFFVVALVIRDEFVHANEDDDLGTHLPTRRAVTFQARNCEKLCEQMQRYDDHVATCVYLGNATTHLREIRALTLVCSLRGPHKPIVDCILNGWISHDSVGSSHNRSGAHFFKHVAPIILYYVWNGSFRRGSHCVLN